MKIKRQYENASNACKEAPDKHCDKFNERCEIDIEISTPDLIAELERRGAIPVIFRGKGGLTDISGSRDFSDAANFQLLLIPEPDFKEAK